MPLAIFYRSYSTPVQLTEVFIIQIPLDRLPVRDLEEILQVAAGGRERGECLVQCNSLVILAKTDSLLL